MARYELRLRKSVERDLDHISKQDRIRIIGAIRNLADNPRPSQSIKLSGAEKYRIRCGMCRVLYEIQDDVLVVCVVKVGHRKDVYRG